MRLDRRLDKSMPSFSGIEPGLKAGFCGAVEGAAGFFDLLPGADDGHAAVGAVERIGGQFPGLARGGVDAEDGGDLLACPQHGLDALAKLEAAHLRARGHGWLAIGSIEGNGGDDEGGEDGERFHGCQCITAVKNSILGR